MQIIFGELNFDVIIMHHSTKSNRIKVTDDMLSQGVALIELDEKELYERLGLGFTLWESRQGIQLEIDALEKPPTQPSYGDGIMIDLHMRKHLLDDALRMLALREDLIKKGKKYFRKCRRDLFQKICVEKKACKWSKEILGDTKSLLLELIPLVGIVLNLTVPAIVIIIAIIIIKWGIIKFCKCPKP